ncbi:unnamed protein product [Notodromas monacha]|uniref:Uncharacterized protein n=1 Tax=Notodromas monacha TaxID=399045 RepID=A0A7R9BR90_9CRUS|nr:unnamed protein product [Notodromas monacha]CAG0919301.1 unnamed protein product [Notodromas monacha]
MGGLSIPGVMRIPYLLLLLLISGSNGSATRNDKTRGDISRAISDPKDGQAQGILGAETKTQEGLPTLSNGRFQSRLEGGVLETNISTLAPYVALLRVLFLDDSGHDTLGLLISKRHVLCTVEALLGRKWTGKGNALKDIKGIYVYLAVGTNDEEGFQNLPPSDIIYYPNYNSSGKVIPDDDSVKREVAIVKLPYDSRTSPLPIQCNPGVRIETEVTAVFDWVKVGKGRDLFRAQYLRVQCPPAYFSKDSTNCFQLSNISAFDVNDMGNLGSPVVLNYGQANATAVAIKAYTFNVTATETMMAAASFSDPEVWSFVCQYAEKCIGGPTTTTSVPSTTTSVPSTTKSVPSTTTSVPSTTTSVLSTSTPLIPTTTPTGVIKNTTSQKVMKTPPGPDSQPPPPLGKWAKFMQFIRGLFA